jgi:PPIC-type PPIASE domain
MRCCGTAPVSNSNSKSLRELLAADYDGLARRLARGLGSHDLARGRVQPGGAHAARQSPGAAGNLRQEIGSAAERVGPARARAPERAGRIVSAEVSALPANFPSDDDLQKVYDAYRAALLVPRQFQLAQIFVALPKGADKTAEDQSKKTVDDLERKLKTPGADFASLANNNGAKNGGDLGLLRENQIRPEIRAKVIELPKGAASEPIRLEDGWHLVKLIDTRAA